MPERVGAILVAAGRSTRMGFDKLWADLGGRPVVAWSLATLPASGVVDNLAFVVAEDRLGGAGLLIYEHDFPMATIVGGERRRDSVAAGLSVSGDCGWVIVHDAARPFVSGEVVRRGLEAARENGAAIAAVPARDTIKRVRGSDVLETLPRSELWTVQTPQVFRANLLREALDSTDEDVTDEAALVERLGATVRVFEGDERNFKITTPADLELARALVRTRLDS